MPATKTKTKKEGRSPGFKGGYLGKILRVDLTSGKIREDGLPPVDVLKKYIGCWGLGLQYLYDMVPPGIDALDAEDRLVRWLNEVLVLAVTRGFLVSGAALELEGAKLRGVLRGEACARAFGVAIRGVSVRSIEHVRQHLVDEGLEAALGRKKQCRPSVEKIFDGEKEAKLIAVACGPKPEGRSRWTLELLADRMVK